MIERACDGENAFDVIVVHSFSRFFRDAFGLEFYVRKLAKHGVRLVSITQELGDDPAQVMMRQVIALFDEYQSKENAKHVLRSMKENARQGFWNGARPPFGYTASRSSGAAPDQEEARHRSGRGRDRPADVPPVPRRRQGSGPMGVKAIAVWLNEHGHRTRGGATWGIGPVHALLSHPVYARPHAVQPIRRRAAGRRKSEAEHVFAEVPAIIEPDVFEQVQSLLKARNPRVTPPRMVTGPILLTGLAVCATCDGAMTLRTGTSKTGKVHRYYTCSTLRPAGQDRMQGPFDPHGQARRARHRPSGRPAARSGAPRRPCWPRLPADVRRRPPPSMSGSRILEKEAHEADERLRRLYKLVEDGVAEMDDILKDRHHRAEGRSRPRARGAGASQIRRAAGGRYQPDRSSSGSARPCARS